MAHATTYAINSQLISSKGLFQYFSSLCGIIIVSDEMFWKISLLFKHDILLKTDQILVFIKNKAGSSQRRYTEGNILKISYIHIFR